MLKPIGKWLNVYEDEIHLFLWTVFLYFLVTGANAILNNYAETAFLKRYGVVYLPIVYMLNAVALFLIMGAMTGLMVRFPGSRILSLLLVFCGISVAGIRFLIPFNIDIIYPALFMLKAQYEALLGLLFWNMANDLFNTRQSKRLFPLITAGGVIGTIIGSFGTPFLARAITLDNLLLFYLGTTLAGAAVVQGMGKAYPTLIFGDKKRKKGEPPGSLISEFKNILPLMKESSLVKFLILITFLPNIIIPIMNYQFNFAVDAQFASEAGLIKFFGYFRGWLNTVSLIILLFVGRLYGRWGLTTALMFHPANYILAFFSFLFRFDVFSAVYARMSTMILRTTINNPARDILMGMVPESFRAVLRPFLRGTVVRVGLLLGSGMILISEHLFHPRYLSLIAVPVATAWLVSVFALRKEYSKILLDLVSKDILDLKSLEKTDMDRLFGGSGVTSRLIQAFLGAKGDSALWYARLIKSLGAKDFDRHLLTVIKRQKDSARQGLIELLSPEAGKEAASLLCDLIKSEKNPDIVVPALRAANRLDPESCAIFDFSSLLPSQHPEIKANALIGLYRRDPGKFGPTIMKWLHSETLVERTAGIIAAGNSGDISFADHLEKMLVFEENRPVLPFIFRGLRDLETKELNDLALPFLSDPSDKIREAALSVIEIENDDILKNVISKMGDTSENISQLANKKIETARYQNIEMLVESLGMPNERIRKGIFRLLEFLNIKALDLFRFARNQIKEGYQYLSDALSLETFPETVSRNLLVNHLNQKKMLRIENVLRVMALQDTSGQMKIIYRGILSSDSRKRANAVEALENRMDKRLFKEMIPLMESSSPHEALSIGKKSFELIGIDSGEHVVLSKLLSEKDWVTVALTLDLLQHTKYIQMVKNLILELATSDHKYIRQKAQKMIEKQEAGFSNI